jgi:hypothetical protein
MNSDLGSDRVSMSSWSHDGFDGGGLFSTASMGNLAMSRTGKDRPQSWKAIDVRFWVITSSRRDNSRRVQVFRIGIAIIS